MPSSASRFSLCAPLSFPPRRSSDLLPRAGASAFEAVRGLAAARLRCLLSRRPRDRPLAWASHLVVGRLEFLYVRYQGIAEPLRPTLRSEEHTSELQSHHDLVCRLLLLASASVLLFLSLHDALPIYCRARVRLPLKLFEDLLQHVCDAFYPDVQETGRWHGHRTWLLDGSSFSMSDTKELRNHFGQPSDRKSTRLNSSHITISYAVFCFSLQPLCSSFFPSTTLFRSTAARGCVCL